MDHAARDSDRHNRRGGHRLREIHRALAPWFSSVAMDMEDRHIWSVATLVWRTGTYNVGLNRQNLLAILSIIVLTWTNTRGLRLGKIVQNIFTVAKIRHSLRWPCSVFFSAPSSPAP